MATRQEGQAVEAACPCGGAGARRRADDRGGPVLHRHPHPARRGGHRARERRARDPRRPRQALRRGALASGDEADATRRSTSSWQRCAGSRRRVECRSRSTPARALAGALVRVRDDLGDAVGAHPRLRPLGGRAGGRLEARDAPPAPGRLPTDAAGRERPRRSVLELLLRLGRARALAVSQGSGLHRGDGVRDRLDQPRDRARDHHGAAARLAVRASASSSAAR